MRTLKDVFEIHKKEYCNSWNDVETVRKNIDLPDSINEEDRRTIYAEIAHEIGGHLIPSLESNLRVLAKEWIKHFEIEKQERNKVFNEFITGAKGKIDLSSDLHELFLNEHVKDIRLFDISIQLLQDLFNLMREDLE